MSGNKKHPLLDHEATAGGEPLPLKRLRGGGEDDFEEEPPFDDVVDDGDDSPPDEWDPPAPQELEVPVVKAVTGADCTKKWVRPPTSFDPTTDDVTFQWMDVDTTCVPPLSDHPNPTKRRAGKTVPGAGGNPMVPILRFYGVTDGGHSVAAFVHGFTPYAYFAIPAGCPLMDSADGDPRRKNEYLADIRRVIDERLKMSCSRGGRDPFNGKKVDGREPGYCLGVRLVTDHKSIMGYETSHTQFVKVLVATPTMVPALKRLVEDGIDLPGISSGDGGIGRDVSMQPFEANVPFVLRFMIDRGVDGSGWVTIPKNTYRLRKDGRGRETHCQLEIEATYDDMVFHKSEGEWSKVAPLRILSFDIECQGRKGHFPEAEQDPVIQIANIVSVYGEEKPIVQNVFTLKGCLPIVGAQVISSDTEAEMLLKWRAFLQAVDADIITGYNVQNFDIPYLLDRADALMKTKGPESRKLSIFRQWGRVKGQQTKKRETTFQSAAYGKRNNVETTVDGRVIFDMLPYMQRNHKLSSYSLNSVCAEFLGQQKEDVHHSIISDLQMGSDEDRHRLAVYCLKDAKLPQLLMDKLSVLVNYIEMARVTGVPLNFLISRGQQIKVYSMLLRKCRNEKLLVPTLNKGRSSAEDGVGYEGATVLDPVKAYYQVPIATLDFASLYPSIMQAYNLCYSTLVSPTDVGRLDPSTYNKSENGNVFVTSETKKGILPTILQELLTARKRAKKDMKNAETEFERAVQNGRQLALKVSANSVYGFTGATVGQLPCLPIASSVTSYGRQLLEKTQAFVEEKYTMANGYEHDAHVIYGDTDSVMVKFGTATVADTFPLAIEAAEKCSSIFPKPIELEFEKVYFPYLLMNKKRYAGLMWTNMDKFDYMDTKGLETVRRDNCALVREVIQTSLDKILIGQDVQGAIGYVKSQIADLLQNKMDISRLVITKNLNKGADYALGLGGKKEDYKVRQAHVELAARMKKRDAGSAPQMGDRVPYVIITGAKGAANFEKAEDPIYVLENNLSIDCKWYLTNQLSKPLTRIFEPIIDNVEKSLLQGEHTRKIFIPTPTARKGSLMMFAVKNATCIGCRASMDAKQGHICKTCRPREAEIYLEKLSALREAETRFADLWSAAQRIHGTLHSDIICTGDGCTCHFYRRKKAQADVRLAQEVMDKFGR